MANEEDFDTKEIIQIAHGRIIPEYSSAYALRVRRYLKKIDSREIISVSGLILRDKKEGKVIQYRSLLMTALALLKGNRALEILLSKSY